MVFQNIGVLVLWTKVVPALEGLDSIKTYLGYLCNFQSLGLKNRDVKCVDQISKSMVVFGPL